MSNADQEEELDSLHAIYGEDCEFDDDTRTCKVYLPSKTSCPHIILRALLPTNYPAEAGPLLEVDAPHMPNEQVAAAAQDLEQLFCPGEVCLFNCIEVLREQLQKWQDQAAAAAASELAAAVAECLAVDDGAADSGEEEFDEELQQLPESSGRADRGPAAASSADAALMDLMRARITSGEPFTERKSTFQAHVAPVTEVDQVKAVVAVLLESNKIRNATHNIMAYRIAAPERPGLFYQDYDDDGEAAAGGRLLHLLQVAHVSNAVVVVSRWFGGVLLGPARFALINNTARQLLEQTGFLQQGTGSSSKHAAGAAAIARKQGKKKH